MPLDGCRDAKCAHILTTRSPKIFTSWFGIGQFEYTSNENYYHHTKYSSVHSHCCWIVHCILAHTHLHSEKESERERIYTFLSLIVFLLTFFVLFWLAKKRKKFVVKRTWFFRCTESRRIKSISLFILVFFILCWYKSLLFTFTRIPSKNK